MCAFADGRNAGLLDKARAVPLWYTASALDYRQWLEGFDQGRDAAKWFGVTDDAKSMVAAVRAAYAANNDNDPYTERDWAVACQNWLDALLCDIVESAALYVFGDGPRVRREIHPAHICDCCTKPALPNDIFCAKHRWREDELEARYAQEAQGE